MPDVAEPIDACPKCGGDVWDNRNDKKTAKSPDFKCKKCNEPYWLAKGAGAKAPSAGRAPVAPRYREELDRQERHETAEVQRIQAAASATSWADMKQAMKECAEFAIDLSLAMAKADIGVDPRATAQIADTLFIQRMRAGV